MNKLFLRDELVDDSLYSNLRYDLSSNDIKRLCEKYLNGLYVPRVACTLFLYLDGLLKYSHNGRLYSQYYELINIRAEKVDGLLCAVYKSDLRIVNCGMLSPEGIPNQFVYCEGYDCSCEAEYTHIRQYLKKNLSKLSSCDVKKISNFIKLSRYNPDNQEMLFLLSQMTDEG